MREFVQVPAGFRHMLEELADLAILILDELEGDVDLEPSLGAGNPHHAVDAEGDYSDYEPSLGSFDRMVDQKNWCERTAETRSDHDSELDTSDDEDGHDAEPDDSGIGDQDGLDEQVAGRWIGTGARFVPADAVAVADARRRLGLILDRVGGRR